MDFKTAFQAIQTKLDAISGLPPCDLNPRNPEMVATHPALFLAPDNKQNVFSGADFKRTQPVGRSGQITCWLHIHKTGSDHIALELMTKAQLIEDAIEALTATDIDFACYVSRVDFVYSENATWAVAIISITVEAYQE